MGPLEKIIFESFRSLNFINGLNNKEARLWGLLKKSLSKVLGR